MIQFEFLPFLSGESSSSNLQVRSTGVQHPLHLLELLLRGVVRDPRALLIIGGVVEALGTLQGLDIKIGDIRLAIRELDADLVVGGEHHVILGQASRAVKHSQDALLHRHLSLVETPRGRVVAALVATTRLGRQGNTTSGVGHAARLGDAVERVLLLQRRVRLGNIVGLVVISHVVVILIILGHRSLGGGGQVVLLQSLVNVLVVSNLRQVLCVDGLGGVLLLNNAQNTVVQVLVKVLSIGKGLRASAALASGVGGIAGERLGRDGTGSSSAAVGGSLLNAVDGSQVSLEDICAVERLLSRGARSGTEATDHSALVVGQGVAVLVILASKPLDVVFTRHDGALLGSLSLVSEHVRLEILEGLAALGIGAHVLLLDLIAAGVVGGDGGDEVAAAVAGLAHAQATRSNAGSGSHGG